MAFSLEPLVSYYRSPAVRARIAEYCGAAGPAQESFGTYDLAGYGGAQRRHTPDGAPVTVPNGEWLTLLGEGADICRSLADRSGTLVQLDVDYCDAADPGGPYRDPQACFGQLEPVHEAVLDAFERRGVRPFVLMTGRGYHYTARAPWNGALHRGLLDIGNPEEALRGRYRREAQERPWAKAMGTAHDGAGRLLEELAHEVVRALRGRAAIPVTLADLPPPEGGPFVCLDMTAYADPLFQRYARCAFSSHQKVSLKGLDCKWPFFICVPRVGPLGGELLAARLDPARAACLAEDAPASLPAVEDGADWLRLYRASRLARFHRDFDLGPRQPRAAWPFTYDTLGHEWLPPCLALPLARPNPLLLRPVHLHSVALGLWGLGWHPRSLATMVLSRYEQDHHWGDYWARYAAASRAMFYMRLFCGALADGLEDPAEFTCGVQAARDACDQAGCTLEKRERFRGLAAMLATRQRSWS